MPRKVPLLNGEIYHIFNRGVEKRTTFVTSRDYERSIQTMDYYLIQNPPIRFSYFLRISKEAQSFVVEKLQLLNKLVDILAFCLMPNHFHFLLRQRCDGGISKFVANFTNSYTKYFNTKNNRVGPLFQGTFKAVQIKDDQQLMHVSRYIHLNPVSSFVIEPNKLENYAWSSYLDYIQQREAEMIDTITVLSLFKEKETYRDFVLDQIDYTRSLEEIKHLTLEDDVNSAGHHTWKV